MSELFVRTKASMDADRATVTDEDMAAINRHTLRTLTAEEVYVFRVVMCNNEVDRDHEAFTVAALKELKTLFIGKTVIADHNWTASGQCARIFATELVEVEGKQTSYGEPLYQLEARCYLLRTEEAAQFIANIEAGILKEVSTGFSCSGGRCSICGADYWSAECFHHAGREYEGKQCFVFLEDIRDAYELSFVAVPAQPGAGVTKSARQGVTGPAELQGIMCALKSLGEAIEKIQLPAKQDTSSPDKAPDLQVEVLLLSAQRLLDQMEGEQTV